MSTNVTSLPNWLRGFDSRRPLHASSQVNSGSAVRFEAESGPGCTRKCTLPTRSARILDRLAVVVGVVLVLVIVGALAWFFVSMSGVTDVLEAVRVELADGAAWFCGHTPGAAFARVGAVVLVVVPVGAGVGQWFLSTPGDAGWGEERV